VSGSAVSGSAVYRTACRSRRDFQSRSWCRRTVRSEVTSFRRSTILRGAVSVGVRRVQTGIDQQFVEVAQHALHFLTEFIDTFTQTFQIEVVHSRT